MVRHEEDPNPTYCEYCGAKLVWSRSKQERYNCYSGKLEALHFLKCLKGSDFFLSSHPKQQTYFGRHSIKNNAEWKEVKDEATKIST